MRDAIATAGVFNLIIIFVIILIAFFVGSLGYTKAFKVKNKIVEEIEKDGEYTVDGGNSTQARVENWLGQIGYRMNTSISTSQCPNEEFNGIAGEVLSGGSNYQYCIYKFDLCANKMTDMKKCSVHYRVVAYMYFDIPVINELLKVPVRGETKSFTTVTS